MQIYKDKSGHKNKQLAVNKKFFNPNAEKNKMNVIWKFIHKPNTEDIPSKKRKKKDYTNNAW